MASAAAGLLGYVLPGLNRKLQRMFSSRQADISDSSFKFATMYVPVLYGIMFILTVGNLASRETALDCRGEGREMTAAEGGNRKFDWEMNDFCGNHETYTIPWAFDPTQSGQTLYPGVASQRNGYSLTRNNSRHAYSKYGWIPLLFCGFLAYVPYMTWKHNGEGTILALLTSSEEQPHAEAERMQMLVTKFLRIAGFNGDFGWQYLRCQILTLASSVVQMGFCMVFFSPDFLYYGVKVIVFFFGSTNPSTPDPRHIVFPHFALCEFRLHGYGGDVESTYLVCQMLLNPLHQIVYFAVWVLITASFCLNVVSIVWLALMTINPIRRCRYRMFTRQAAREIRQRVLAANESNGNNEVAVQVDVNDGRVNVNISFGDWLVLTLLRRNLGEPDFHFFMQELLITQNEYLQIEI